MISMIIKSYSDQSIVLYSVLSFCVIYVRYTVTVVYNIRTIGRIRRPYAHVVDNNDKYNVTTWYMTYISVYIV